MLPTFQRDLHTSQGTVTWLLTVFLLSASIFTPILGRVGDMVGKERMLVVTLLALATGTVIAGLAQSIGVLIVARAIQGIGGAVLPLSFGIIRDEFPAAKVPTGVGIVAAMAAVGGGAGIVLAGPIVSHLNYHWLFWIPLIISLTAAVCAHFFVPESPVRTPGKISWLGAILLSGWLVALLDRGQRGAHVGMGLREGPRAHRPGRGDRGDLGDRGVPLEGAAGRHAHDADPRGVDQQPGGTAASGWGCTRPSASYPSSCRRRSRRATDSGPASSSRASYLLPLTVAMFVVGMLSGRIAAAIGSKSAVVIGSVFSCGGYLILAFAHSHPWEIYTSSALLGVGIGLAFAAMSNLIVQAVPPSQTGVASGMNANIRTIGGAIGAGIMSSIVTSMLVGQLSGRERLPQRLRLPGRGDRGGHRGRRPHPDVGQSACRRRPGAPSAPHRTCRAGPGARQPGRPSASPTASTPAADRLRRDAARNRDKILAAARATFDEEGVDVGRGGHRPQGRCRRRHPLPAIPHQGAAHRGGGVRGSGGGAVGRDGGPRARVARPTASPSTSAPSGGSSSSTPAA